MMEVTFDISKLWSQEFMGFLAVIATLATFIHQTVKSTESRNTQNSLSKIDLWFKFQQELNSLIKEIDAHWNELVQFDEDVKKICLTKAEDLKGKKRDQILNSTNNIIRTHAKLFSLKKQFTSLYSQIDKEFNIVESLDTKWNSDIETYFFFYFDEEKRPLFISAYNKTKKLDNLSKEFCDYVDNIIVQNKSYNEEKLKKVA